MKKNSYILLIFLMLIILGAAFTILYRAITPSPEITEGHNSANETTIQYLNHSKTMIKLPDTRTRGNVSLEETLLSRRSVRSYSAEPLTLEEVSQLLWSAQGITNKQGFRTAPSAGATFPLEVFIMANDVTGLKKGIYHYDPKQNTLELIHEKDLASEIAKASWSQSMIADAPVVVIFGAVFERTTQRYEERGIRYVYNEIGHASQNLHLQAVALKLGTVAVGAYNDEEVEAILSLDSNIRVLYMMPVGKTEK